MLLFPTLTAVTTALVVTGMPIFILISYEPAPDIDPHHINGAQ